MAPATYQGPAPLPPVYAAAPPVVQYSDPSPSFWTGAATFAGGAAIGGLLGYVIGDDDDDDNDWDWNNNDDWDDLEGDVDDIADDVDELTEGFEDFREDAGERADELAQQREERADQLQQSREERADQLAEGREQRADQWRSVASSEPISASQQPKIARRRRTSCATSSRHTSQSRCRTSSASARGCPSPPAIGQARQRVAALGDGSAGLAPASVKRPADAPGLAARKPSAGTRPAVQRQAGAGARTASSPNSGQGPGGKAGGTTPGRAGGEREAQERAHRTQAGP